jgi:PAS domain S-box-containing protein
MCDATRVRYANRAAAGLLGYDDPETLLTRHPLDDLVQPEHRAAFQQAIGRLVEGVRPSEQFWISLRRRDGTPVRAHIRAMPVQYPDRPCVGLVAIDVGEQERVTQAAGLLGRAVDAVSEAVLVVDGNGLILYANQAADALFGAAAGGLVATQARRLLGRTMNVRVLAERRTNERERYISSEATLRRVSGDEFPASLSISVFPDPESGGQLAMAIIRDLTEARRDAEVQAFRQRQLELMLREAHHRIKNSLQVASDVLALQGAAASTETRTELEGAAARIRALAALHEGISLEGDVALVPAGPLLTTVAHGVREAVHPPFGPVALDVDVADIAVSSRAAQAVALIASELLRCACAHADAVRVRFSVAEDVATLEITCRHTPSDVPRPVLEGFSASLVQLLVEDQLRGNLITDETGPWMSARVEFPLPHPAAD